MLLPNLNDSIRQIMVREIQADIENGRLYVSTRLNPSGRTVYPGLLLEAASARDVVWLEQQIRQGNLLLLEEPRTSKLGKTSLAKVPITAAATLAEGEMNRYYLRALCIHAMASGADVVQVCRGKEVSQPRPESEALVGTRVSAEALLRDLRANVGVDTALGIPAGPNSGLTCMLCAN
jgi:hypothetical protein